MKIYVVVEFDAWDGYSDPKAAFNTLGAAREFASRAGDLEIWELVLGDPDTAPRKIT